MRVEVIGDSDSAKAIRKGLNLEGFVTDPPGTHKLFVDIDSKSAYPFPAVDGVDSELERVVVTCLAKTANTSVLLLRPGGIQSEDNLRLVIPGSLLKESSKIAKIEEGVIKGYGLFCSQKQQSPSRWRFWSIFLLFFFTQLVFSQQQGSTVVRATDQSGNLIPNLGDAVDTALRVKVISGAGGGGATATATAADPSYSEGQTNASLSLDLAGYLRVLAKQGASPWSFIGTLTDNNAAPGANLLGAMTAKATASAPSFTEGRLGLLSTDLAGALRIICMSGCGGAAPFSDNAAFTAGASSIANVGGVFNEGLGAVTSGNAAAPRITSFRAFHTNLRDNSGNEISSATVTPGAAVRGIVTRAVSNTDRGVTASVTWDNTSALDSTLEIDTYNQGTVLVTTRRASGTCTGGGATGIITFEHTVNDGTNWGPISGSQRSSTGAFPILSITIRLSVNSTLNSYVFPAAGSTDFRARLSEVILPSGCTVQVTLTASGIPYIQHVVIGNIASVTGIVGDNTLGGGANKMPTLPARSNASLPSFNEGIDNPLSIDLSGRLRTTALSGFFSTANATVTPLTASSSFNGSGEECGLFGQMFTVYVLALGASAPPGTLSMEQSRDNSNWDIIDLFGIAGATAGVDNVQTFSIPIVQRWCRVNYTNGGTNQTTFRLDTFYQPGERHPTPAQTYIAAVTGVTSAASKDYINLSNASGSDRVIRILKIYGSTDSQAAVTGLQPGFTMSRFTTVGTTCTAGTVTALDTANLAVPSQVTVNHTCTTDPTGLTTLSRVSFYPDDTQPGTQILWSWSDRGQPITLREGQGVTLIAGATAPVGVLSLAVEFIMTRQ